MIYGRGGRSRDSYGGTSGYTPGENEVESAHDYGENLLSVEQLKMLVLPKKKNNVISRARS